MFTRIAIAALATLALGAGAFAVVPPIADKTGITDHKAQTTIVQKNQAWPFKDRITMNPCAYAPCQEV